MATTIYKVKGATVTQAEADAAAAAYEPQTGYKFKSWSTSRTTEVTAAFPMVVDRDLNFYPVIEMEELFKSAGLPDGTYTNYNGEKYLTCPALNDFTELTEAPVPSAAGRLSAEQAKNYLHLGATVGGLNEGQPSSPFMPKFKDIIDFGFIPVAAISDASSFTVVSPYSNCTYYLKMTKTDSGFDIELYALYDAYLTSIAPTGSLGGLTLGALVLADDVFGEDNNSFRYFAYDAI